MAIFPLNETLDPCDIELSNLSAYANISSCFGGGEGFTNSARNNSNATTAELDPHYFFKVEQLTFLGILLFVIVVGNVAVLTALFLAKTQRKSRMNFFIMHLALADLSVGLINVLTDLIWKFIIVWHFGNIPCKLIRYFQTVVLYSSNYVLVALSIDRYDAITHPLRFSGSWRRARMLVAMAWTLSFIFSTPVLYIFKEKEVGSGGANVTQCWADFPGISYFPNLKEIHQWRIYISIVFLIIFLFPTAIIAFCYTTMVSAIWSQSKILTPQANNTPSNGFFRKSTARKNENLIEDDSRRASSRGLIPKAKIKSVKMTFVIVFVFILCSSPYFVFSLLDVYNLIPRPNNTVNALATFFQSLAPLNSAANPIIYCLFSTNICRNLRKLKWVDWLATKFCPRFGISILGGVGARRKFGLTSHPHDLSGKTTRSDFTTSLTDSLMRSTKSSNSSRIAAAAFGIGNRRHRGNEIILNPQEYPMVMSNSNHQVKAVGIAFPPSS